MMGLIIAALLVAPTPSPTPLKVIAHARASAACALLHENIAPSVGAVLRNDVAIRQAGASVSEMVQSINGLGGDSPYGNPGVAFAQIQLLNLGNRLVQDNAEINRLLADPRFDTNSDPDLAKIKQSLQRIVDQQSRLLNIIFSMAWSSHPADLRYYPDPVQDEVREAIRREPNRSVVPGDVFGPFETIANQNIAQTQILEGATASQIVAMAPGCGDNNVMQTATQGSIDEVQPRVPEHGLAVSPGADLAAYSAARDFYTQLVQGAIDRTRLSRDLDNRLTPSFVATISAELAVLGAPRSWQYVGVGNVSSGKVALYRLSYGSGVLLYYGYGADSDGTIFAIFMGTKPPPNT